MPFDGATTIRAVLAVKHLLSRRPRSLVPIVALVGLFGTFAVMMLTDSANEIGAIGLVPWVGLFAYDVGLLGGLAVAGVGLVLWFVAADTQSLSLSALTIGVRVTAFLVFAVGSSIVGRRMRESDKAHRTQMSLQSALIDSTLDGICLTDVRGNVLISNVPLRRLSVELGLPPTGTVPDRLIAVAGRTTEPDRYRKRMREIAEQPMLSSEDEFELRGSGRVFRGYTSPTTDADGRFTGRIWTLREVTADRELDRLRDAFVAAVSHELRTPLTSISGFLEMLREEEAGLGESGRMYLDVIRRSTERLQRLVEDLLLVAQIEAHRLELVLATVDLDGIAAAAVEAARPTAVEKEVDLRLQVDGAPPVRADAHRLAQVLDNLISNALKFTDAGGEVIVSVERRGSFAQLAVTDNGIGIPIDEQGQLFSSFFRASTATRQAIPGTGLGLVIVRAIVEQHGGSIDLESREGKGTTVTVTLPAAAEAPA
ncbi:MAG TPA: HAMP domain-containing sensor histidine kinase [Gaiellaceae bacterium]|nr:HAMP domain-containing sensor histidine kinase [Gaiellaceae bacterium]